MEQIDPEVKPPMIVPVTEVLLDSRAGVIRHLFDATTPFETDHTKRTVTFKLNGKLAAVYNWDAVLVIKVALVDLHTERTPILRATPDAST